jgi:hypothetical protein
MYFINIYIMLNPLIDSENITKTEKQNSDDKQKQSGDISSDSSCCVWCNFDFLFRCCLG